jgi:hypothetical protein
MSSPIRERIAVLGAAALLALLMLSAAGDQAAAREVVPAPPVVGPGESVFPPDNAPLPPGSADKCPVLGPEHLGVLTGQGKAKFPDDIGGDDVLVLENAGLGDVSMDIAANGDIYLAITRSDPGVSTWIEVYRSEDNGNTFALWGSLGGSDYYHYKFPHLKVIEGDVSGCYIVFSARPPTTLPGVWLARSPLGGSSASWDPFVTVMEVTGIVFNRPRFDTDVFSYSDFYLYVVAEGLESDGATGQDIWFARSTDQGASFEAPYQLATLAVPDRNYFRPDISVGYGGWLHACWEFGSSDGSFDSSVRYRRGPPWGNGGLAAWDYWVTMTPTNDGHYDVRSRVEAGHASYDVVLAYVRLSGDPYWYQEDTRLRLSDDTGLSWGATVTLEDGPSMFGQIIENPSASTWYMMGLHGEYPKLWTASSSDLTSWSGGLCFSDTEHGNYYAFHPDLALSPVKDNRPAVAWIVSSSTEPYQAYFDADWRGDPGFPNLEPGFPMGIWAAPRSAPAVVDVDGDGDLEIVFADGLDQIQVINHDGSSPPGWPVPINATLSDGPVAVGDLDGDGEMTLVVGTTDGRVFAYDPTGSLLPGWPVTLIGVTGNTYVSIGALGGPFLRTVVACCGNRLFFYSHHGTFPPDVPYWNMGTTYTFTSPAAIGDIDDDGTAEVVNGMGPYLFALEMGPSVMDIATSIGETISDAPTLGDLDLDGDLEILYPTTEGTMHVLDHTGAEISGFPFTTGTTYDMTSGAIAQCYGTMQREIAFGCQNYTVYMLQYTGNLVLGYPTHTGTSWWLWGAPIIGRVDGSSADVVVGARDKNCWAWTNLGALIEGWPTAAGGYVQVSPAMGDLDLDGAVEVVFVSDTQLLVMDINNTETDDYRTWPMYGHDPQRTGCSDCPEDLVTSVDPDAPVDEGAGAITRVRFAPPSPNPVFGATTFEFAVPLRAAVSLDIFDVRGRRVYTVYRQETEPGVKTVTWHGRNERGEPLASGQYLARLRVQGPGIKELLTRKVTVLR